MKMLQLRAPTHSTVDRAFITAAMAAHEIFPRVREDAARASLLLRLLDVSGRIPSLYTFLEDTKSLEPCATIMRALVPLTTKNSLWQSFAKCCEKVAADGKAVVEVRPDTWQEVHVGGPLAVRLVYLVLWLFCHRNFPYMLAVQPRKDAGQPKPRYETNQRWWALLGQLAARLGVESHEIQALKDQDPFQDAVRTFVLSAGLGEAGRCGGELDQPVQDICNILRRVSRSRTQTGDTLPAIATDDVEEPLSHRCGRPFDLSYRRDRPYMYLKYMCGSAPRETGRYLSSFGVKLDIFQAFFGSVSVDFDSAEPNPPPDSPPPDAPASRSSRHESAPVQPPDNAPGNTLDRGSSRYPSTLDGFSGMARSPTPVQDYAREQSWGRMAVERLHSRDASAATHRSDYFRRLEPEELGPIGNGSLEAYEIQCELSEPVNWRHWLADDEGSLFSVYFHVPYERLYVMPASHQLWDERETFRMLQFAHAIYVVEDDGFNCITDAERLCTSQLRILVEKGTEKFNPFQMALLESLFRVYYPRLNSYEYLQTLGHTCLY